MFHHNYVYSLRQRQTIHWGQNFDDEKGLFSLPIIASFKMISLKSDFINIFNDFIHVYSPGARAETPLGKKLLMSTESSYYFDQLLKFQINLFEF